MGARPRPRPAPLSRLDRPAPRPTPGAGQTAPPGGGSRARGAGQDAASRGPRRTVDSRLGSLSPRVVVREDCQSKPSGTMPSRTGRTAAPETPRTRLRSCGRCDCRPRGQEDQRPTCCPAHTGAMRLAHGLAGPIRPEGRCHPGAEQPLPWPSPRAEYLAHPRPGANTRISPPGFPDRCCPVRPVGEGWSDPVRTPRSPGCRCGRPGTAGRVRRSAACRGRRWSASDD
jgi:hypothetical protein